MEKINNVLPFFLIGIILYLAFFYKPKPIETHITSIDTLWSPSDTVVIHKPIVIKEKALHDTVWLSNQNIEVAKLDTVIDSSRIKIDYYFPPIDSFGVSIRLGEKIVTKTVTLLKTVEVTKLNPFYKNEWFYATIAFLIITIMSLLK